MARVQRQLRCTARVINAVLFTFGNDLEGQERTRWPYHIFLIPALRKNTRAVPRDAVWRSERKKKNIFHVLGFARELVRFGLPGSTRVINI